MGRLQRKKSVTKKKKQTSGDAAPAVSSAETDRKISPAVASDEARRKQSLPQKKAPVSVSRDGWVGKGVQFLREVKAELKKVTWPSRKQTVGSTVVVIVLVMIISLFLGVVDMGLSSLIRLVLQ